MTNNIIQVNFNKKGNKKPSLMGVAKYRDNYINEELDRITNLSQNILKTLAKNNIVEMPKMNLDKRKLKLLFKINKKMICDKKIQFLLQNFMKTKKQYKNKKS
ncbi:MAG: hypothetical protein Ta2D_12350 [Rickettsiales bacterium]|nr:MAG: hypothetical protein Ta2D_12350 [Rickettsiales bacterium]